VSNFNEILSQLETISEQLADEAAKALKAAHGVGATKRPESERQITQARRAIEKAIGVLSRLD